MTAIAHKINWHQSLADWTKDAEIERERMAYLESVQDAPPAWLIGKVEGELSRHRASLAFYERRIAACQAQIAAVPA